MARGRADLARERRETRGPAVDLLRRPDGGAAVELDLILRAVGRDDRVARRRVLDAEESDPQVRGRGREDRREVSRRDVGERQLRRRGEKGVPVAQIDDVLRAGRVVLVRHVVHVAGRVGEAGVRRPGRHPRRSRGGEDDEQCCALHVPLYGSLQNVEYALFGNGAEPSRARVKNMSVSLTSVGSTPASTWSWAMTSWTAFSLMLPAGK